jgi:nucleotide-binding universal stress UspA family protein
MTGRGPDANIRGTSNEGDPAMYRKILVGYDGRSGGRDALALAGVLRAQDGVVTAAAVHPVGSEPALDLPQQADEDWLELRAVAGHSPAHGLHVLSEEIEPELVVVGSSERGQTGQVHAGKTGERLLNGSPCAVAVAPLGFAADAGTPRVIGIAYDGSDESETALHDATGVALDLDAALRIITAVPPLQHLWSGEAFAAGIASADEIRQQRHEAFRKELAAVAESAPPAVRAQPVLAAGRPADVIADEAERGIHLLFVGSRSYGPIRRVMVGSTAIELMRRAPCPMIVIPRAALAVRPGTDARTPETTTAA